MGAMQLGSRQTRLCDSPLIHVVLANAKAKRLLGLGDAVGHVPSDLTGRAHLRGDSRRAQDRYPRAYHHRRGRDSGILGHVLARPVEWTR
jgi:hypothetical protein